MNTRSEKDTKRGNLSVLTIKTYNMLSLLSFS